MAIVSVTLAFGVTLFNAATATANATWLAPQTLSEAGQAAANAQFAVAPDGTVHAVWQRSDGAKRRIEFATQSVGGTWTTPLTLSEAGQDADYPEIAVAADGTVHVIWYRYDGSKDRIQATARSTAGVWSTPQTLSESGQHANGQQIAVAADGTVHAIWRRLVGSEYLTQVATRTTDGTWSTPQTLSEAGQYAYAPQIAVAANGTAHAIWARGNGTNDVIQVATRSTDGTWSTPQTLTATDRSANSQQITVAPDGTVYAIWRRWADPYRQAQVATRAIDGTWSTPQGLSDDDEDAVLPQIAVAADGTAHVIWNRTDGSNIRIQTVTRSTDGTWSTPQTISNAGQNASAQQLAIAADGTIHATWIRFDGSKQRVEFTTRATNGTWATPVQISEAGQSASGPQIAVATDGTVHALWLRSDGSKNRVQATVLDTSGPTLDDLTVPATATVDSPVSVSVTPVDRWSALGSVTWDFGDGTTATGNTATHTYTTAGSYTVTVTAADEHGNTTTATRTIVVNAAPLPPAPPTLPTPPVDVTPTPTPVATPPAPTCSGRFLTLTDIAATTTRNRTTVRLTGLTNPGAVGRPVIVWRGDTQVGQSVVASNGTIRASVSAPRSSRQRYRLTIGTLRSSAHQTSRNATITSRRTDTQGRTTITGRITGITRPTRLVLTGKPVCGTTKPTTIRVRTDRRGRFTVALPAAPEGVPAVTYRIRYGTKTVSLPTTVTRR